LDKIHWPSLSLNPSAIHIIEQNLDKVDWSTLSLNPRAIHLLEKNFDKINWCGLSQNPGAIHILEKNLEKINWYLLSYNPSAIHIFEKNVDKIPWFHLSQNPAIFVLDTNAMRQQIMHFGKKNVHDFGFAQELFATVLHPRHFERNLIQYDYDICLNEYTGFD
jgi:hypothetical protein